MEIAGAIHGIAASAALLLGALVVFAPKGTARHRLLGRLYFFSMIVLNLTALSVYRLFNGFGPFHWAALFSLATVAAGILTAWLRKPAGAWLQFHSRFMCWSYAGLVSAGVSQLTSSIRGLSFFWSVIVPTVVVCSIAAVIIERNVPRTIRRLGSRS